MQRRFRRRNLISVIIAFVMVAVTIMNGTDVVQAASSVIPTASQTNSVVSSKHFTEEYYKVTTPLEEDNVVYVEGRTKIKTTRFCIRMKRHGDSKCALTVFVTPNDAGEFSIKINTSEGNKEEPEVIDGKGIVAAAEESWDTRPGYKAVQEMKSGIYHLTVARAQTENEADISNDASPKWYEGPLGGVYGYAYKEVLLSIKNGEENNPKVIKYNKAIENNNSVRNLYEKKSYHDESYVGSYVRYEDKYLNDMKYLLLENPSTGKIEKMTSSKVSYLKKVGDEITADADTDYEKLLKIYEYVASNIYYDKLANQKFKNQYANPYKNIYNLRNKVTSANSSNGKVATTCQGYAGMVIALARCQGIPARIVTGHHISQPQRLWGELSSTEIKKNDHWWAEAWVDGRWIIIDTVAATYSKWERSSFSSKGTWKAGKEISYAHFDPSIEIISNSLYYDKAYQGATAGKYINRANEIKQLRAFLNTKHSGKLNGKRLNKSYSSQNFATWGTNKTNNFNTNGYGRVTHISWGDNDLYGKLNLTDFSKLKFLTVYSNDLKTLNLKGCTSLVSVNASYNDLTSFDSSSAKANVLNLKGNKLTTAKFKNGSKTITIKRNIKVGSFAFRYDKSKSKKLTIYASDAPKGYKYLGIYNGSGKKLSSSKTYSCSAGAGTYIVKYKKK